jgi:hypothetical protein
MAGFITMATTTPNYGWPVPTSTDFVKDGATAIEALGDAIDATVFGLPAAGLTLVTAQSFTTSAAVNVNNCFTSTYQNYKVLIYADFSANAFCDFRFRTSGADNTASNYRHFLPNNAYDASGVSGFSGQDVNFIRIMGSSTGTKPSVFSMDVFSPQVVANTNALYITSGEARAGAGGGIFNDTTQFDGFSFFPTSGTLTGTLKVYGYKN